MALEQHLRRRRGDAQPNHAVVRADRHLPPLGIERDRLDRRLRTREVLLELVPTGSDLIVETKIDPKDIADIIIGQDVKISLSAYDPSKFGRIDGIVLSISADAQLEGVALPLRMRNFLE